MSIPSQITAATRKTKRFADVVGVLVRHGYADVVERSGIAGLIEGGLEKLGIKGHTPPHKPMPEAERLRHVLEELGATFIKLGQILSTRPDLVPAEIATEFKKLQSDAPKVEFEEIKGRLLKAFPAGLDSLFQSIDEEPLAAASIAQVHRAVLQDGTQVVLKVIRPGIEEVVQGDIAILRDLARITEHYFERLGFSPMEVVDEFAKKMEIELDLVHEGRSTDRMNRYFSDDDRVRFPAVFWQASAKKVLALEEIQGVQLSKLDAATLAQDERRQVCETGATAVFRMCLEFGHFHADPHPGNLFVIPGGGVAFIDWGMTGHLERRTRFQLGQLVRAVLEADLDRLIRLAIDLTGADPALERDRAFRGDLWEMITRFDTGSIEGLDIGALLNHFFEVLRKYRIRCPSDLVYLIKALVTIEGVAEELDPEFDLMSHVQPLMRRLFAQHYGVSALKERLSRSLEGYIEILEQFPAEIRDLIIQLRRSKYTLTVKHEGLNDLRDSVLRASQFLAMALILSATLVSSAILIHIESSSEKGVFTLIGRVTLFVSLVFIVVMGVSAWKKRQR